jgi:tetratricopeptide (TPR) repeat protein
VSNRLKHIFSLRLSAILFLMAFLPYNYSLVFAQEDTIVVSEMNESFRVADSLALVMMQAYKLEDYDNLIRRGDWAFKTKQYHKAIDFYERALQLQPQQEYPRQQLRIVSKKTRKTILDYMFPSVSFEKSSTLIQALMAVIIYSTISMILLLIYILFHRNKLQKLDKIKQELKEKYQSKLMDYLFDADNSTDVIDKINAVAKDSFKRVILADEMKDLMVNLSGDAADRMRDLYYKLNLDVDSEIKVFSSKWHIKVKGFRELAFMNIKRVNEEIVNCLQSRNPIVRMEAQLALVRLNDEDRFSFLDNIKRPFTLWEQINVHEMIVAHNLEVPDFSRWLSSPNRTVILFALRMIKVFDQKSVWEKIIPLLENEDVEIRNMAIFVLGRLKVKETLPHFKHIYKNETYENCLAILQAMRNMPDEMVLSFLKLVLDKEDDVQLQIEATKAIYEIGEVGEKALEKLMNSDYKNYQIIIKHVLDKRI